MPLLTPALFQKIRRIIEKHHNAFVVGAFGPKAVDPATRAQLRKEGMAPTPADAIKDAYLYGQAQKQAGKPPGAGMKQDEFKKWLKDNPIALSPAEEAAVDAANTTAALYCQGLGNVVEKETGQLLVDADQELRDRLEEGIREETAKNIAARETVKQLKTDLGWKTRDWTRNLERIAITEKHNAMQLGLADAIAKKRGDGARVAKRTMPGCCQKCTDFYTGPDGHPRIFKLSQLAGPGANVKRKQADWVPCIGSTHPHCQCEMFDIPDGYGFDEKGDLMPGGKFGVAYDAEGPEELQKAFAAERDHIDALWKARKLAGKMTFQGLPISIEQAKGDVRFWKDRNGEQGKTTMLWPYGYVRGTEGSDGDQVDVYVGPNPAAPNVFVIHQRKKLKDGFGGYDEDKCMLGFSNPDEAKAAYLAHYNDPGFFGSMSVMTMEAFKESLETRKGKALHAQIPESQRTKAVERFHVNLLEKAGGEGSRGGHVIGHTTTGKPVYAKQGVAPGSPEHTRALVEHLRDEHGVTLDVGHRGTMVELSRIVVPPEKQGQGVGTRVMKELTHHADKHGLRIGLTPSGDFGGSVTRLKKFYGSHGFKPNKGRSKDFETRETMIRTPQEPMEKAGTDGSAGGPIAKESVGVSLSTNMNVTTGSGPALQAHAPPRPTGGLTDGLKEWLESGIPVTTQIYRDPHVYEFDEDNPHFQMPINLNDGVMATSHDLPDDDEAGRQAIERIGLQALLVPRFDANPGTDMEAGGNMTAGDGAIRKSLRPKPTPVISGKPRAG